MTAEDFIYEITARYNMYQSTAAGVIVRPEYKYILKDYKDFSNKNGKILAEVMERLRDNYEYNSPPKKALLNQLAGAIYTERDTKKEDDEAAIENTRILKCNKCGVLFSIRSGICPECLSADVQRYPDYGKEDFIRVQPDCYRCKFYRQKGQKVFGPKCQYYGNRQEAEKQKVEGKEHPCTVCKCRDCCDAQFWYETNYQEYKVRYGKGSEIYLPDTFTPYWFDPEVPALGRN